MSKLSAADMRALVSALKGPLHYVDETARLRGPDGSWHRFATVEKLEGLGMLERLPRSYSSRITNSGQATALLLADREATR